MMRGLAWVGLALMVMACGGDDGGDDEGSGGSSGSGGGGGGGGINLCGTEDIDCDGFKVGEDCDDSDPKVNPDASDRVGDDKDQNCDGVDGRDEDGDGVASTSSGGTDCNDDDAKVKPGAPDFPGDGKDADCDGEDGEDADGDGYVIGEDCNDGNANIKPGASDTFGDGLDQNCDGVDGVDADGDGYAKVTSQGGGDCDDTKADVHPGAMDPPGDCTDNDCDGQGGPDSDGDGFEDKNCGGDDCDDTDPQSYVNAVDNDWTVATIDATGSSVTRTELAAGPTGELGVVALGSNARYFGSTGTGASWSAAQIVATSTPSAGISFTPAGEPKVVARGTGLQAFYYSQSGQIWTGTAIQTAGTSSDKDFNLVIDGAGIPHVVFIDGSVLKYYTKPAIDWLVENPVGSGSASVPELALGPDGQPQILVRSTDRLLTRSLAGLWSEKPLTIGGFPSFAPGAAQNYYVYDQTGNVFEMMIDDGTPATTPVAGDTGATYLSAVALAGSVLHIAYTRQVSTSAGFDQIRYARFDGNSWSWKILDQGQIDAAPAIAIDSSGQVHVTWATDKTTVRHAVNVGVVDGKDQDCDGSDG